ncbi:hypothetical protein JY651_02295 [Pyxidicoccus parkwayensis]|uniref:Uncharacterized protein n=1 Tax=Pyxidicoccus parkwayensis TaxID=2813578 RepID=A0ABX7P1J7_9BACT|nr:hypothetical protein [Pyxidicoccus parkwaysis]QSQ23836.1 hypothetical protein JY651_02295 [Pyxidicoccus parkwaysis]
MKTKSRALLALAGLLVTLGLIYAASASVVKSAGSTAALRDDKFARAERLVFYRLEPGREMRLKVPSDAEELRVVTHLMLPEGTTYAPERQYQYGLKLLLRGPDQVLLEKSLFTRTRQSKAQPQEDGTWLQESAFATDPNVQVTDEREFLVRLPPPPRPEPAVMYFRPAGTHGTLLVRVYVRTQRRLPLLTSQRAEDQRAEQRVERTTFLPFEKLSAETRHKLTEEKWERLSAEGEAGTDYFIEPVYRTPFRLPLVEVAESEQERLGAGSSVALNVRGPTQAVLWLWSTSPDTEGGTPTPAGPVTVRALGPTGAERTWDLPALSSGAPVSHVLDVPEGMHTLSIHNAGKEDLRYTVEGPAGAWLAPEALRPTTQPDSRIAWLPDTRRTEAFVTGPGCSTLELEVDANMDAAGRLLRLDARRLGVTGAEDEKPSDLVLTVLDARGKVMGQARTDVGAQPAAFESADVPRVPGQLLPCAEARTAATNAVSGEVTDRPMPVSVPTSARVFLPAGARKVRVQASKPTAVSLSTFLQPQGGMAGLAPYLDEGLQGVRWRNAPLDKRNWYPLRPANVTALTRRGARLELLSQVRLEPEGLETVSAPSGTTVVLAPLGGPDTQEVLEPVQGMADATRALSTLLMPGRAVRTRFDARSPSRPELRLSLEDATGLGSEVEVVLDGEPVHRWTLRSTRARELLPPLPPGEHEVMLRTSAEGLTATLNRPPVAGSGLGARTVYRMGGEGLSVPVRKPGAGAVTVNIVVYTQQPESGPQQRLSVTLDNGQPLRRSGVLLPRITRASRVLPLPASTRAPATPVGRPQVRWYSRTVSVTLGEDLAPGLHHVRVVPQGMGNSPLWARFFMFGHADSEQSAQEWNRTGWELEDAL